MSGKNTQRKFKTAFINLTSAQILALNATPLEVVPAPGASKYIKVHDAVTLMTFGVAAYATQTTLQLITDTADTEQASCTAVLAATASKNQQFIPQGTVAAGGSQLVENKGLKVRVPSANPTTSGGTGTAVVRVVYEVIDMNF